MYKARRHLDKKSLLKLYCKILGLCRRSSASEMFVTNNILNFEALMRKSIFCIYQSLVNLQQCHYLHNPKILGIKRNSLEIMNR